MRCSPFLHTNYSITPNLCGTVDGRNQANQLRLVVYPVIYKVLAPSQVVQDSFQQQYLAYKPSYGHDVQIGRMKSEVRVLMMSFTLMKRKLSISWV